MTQIPDGPEDSWCPFWKKRQSSVCKTCPMWVKHTMVDPRTNLLSDNWACAFAVGPQIAVQTMHRSMGVQQAVESFRNEMVRQNEEMMNQTQERRLEGINAARKYLEGKSNG